jgi:hypothetical protein
MLTGLLWRKEITLSYSEYIHLERILVTKIHQQVTHVFATISRNGYTQLYLFCTSNYILELKIRKKQQVF